MKINTPSNHFLIKKSDFKDLFNVIKICLFLLIAFAFQIRASNASSVPNIIVGSQQQKKNITGTVADVSGVPIIGANIVEVGTTNGTVTDVDGNFSLDVE
ncbi:MAG: carboxypeptidase-like regulatory domain-containing protein, partial [Tissierellia bacterium]|nr:carboxypeptidase-like regulatory domain-containing protein [Tissierellia bacterium]